MTKRCDFPDCKKKILSLAIDCNKCKHFYCNSHRLPEEHNCEFLIDLKKEAFDSNKKILDENKLVSCNFNL